MRRSKNTGVNINHVACKASVSVGFSHIRSIFVFWSRKNSDEGKNDSHASSLHVRVVLGKEWITTQAVDRLINLQH